MVSNFRKAYSVVGVVLLLQYFLQLYFIAAAVFSVWQANDNQKDVYAGFKNGDKFAGIHAGNGDLAGIMIIILVILSFAARQPWRTTILSGVLFVLIFLQSILAHTGIALLSALHGVNALFLIGLTGYLTGANWAFRRPASAGVTPP